MAQKIKAVFFDIDGTIYYHDLHDMLPSTKQALLQLHQQGIKVGIATSRCRYELKNMPSFFRNFPFAAIVSDGGALVSVGDEIISAQFIDRNIVDKVMEFANKRHKTLRYSTIDGDYFSGEPNQSDKDIFFRLYLNTPRIKPYEQDDVLNILLYAEKEEMQELLKLLQGITYVNHGPVMEINAGMIDKSDGIMEMAKRWHIPMDQIMSFGDGYNDIELVSKCGIGVAMGNGCDEVKQAADFITKKIEDDGIMYALQHYEIL